MPARGSQQSSTVPPKPSEHLGAGWIRVRGPHDDQTTPWVGKWLLYLPPDQVDGAWDQIATATLDGRLGVAAKVADRLLAEHGARHGRDVLHVCCVYTADCRDTADVARVLGELRELGFTQRLSYKEDAATLTGVYGQGAALYVAQPGSLEFTRRRLPVDPATISTDDGVRSEG
jgi:Domain of unknown function (DUF1917)